IAIGTLERALAIVGRQNLDPWMVAHTRHDLSQALWAVGRHDDARAENERARVLAKGLLGNEAADIRGIVDEWARTHARGCPEQLFARTSVTIAPVGIDPHEVATLSIAPGTIVAGRYAVERCLGRGGMGVVFGAQDLHLQRRVALKFILGVDAGGREASRIV